MHENLTKICQIILSGDLLLAQKLIESQDINVKGIRKYFYGRSENLTILDMVKPKGTRNGFSKKIKAVHFIKN